MYTHGLKKRNTCIIDSSSQNTRCFRKISVELKSTISLLNFNTKNEMPVSVINAIPCEINGYSNFNKNELHNVSMGTKKILNVKHDFWKQTSKHKQMLLVGVHLHEKRGNYVSLTFIKKT